VDTDPYVFADVQDLANTNVCDTCHSPGGVYNGVNDPNIGAKDNWANGIFTGGDFQAGKEKWCVGCHDNVPSVINTVSAPNMAGDDIDFGYYKTGHGKHGSESITCLACHDPALMHVDGVARTYSAASDNYQSGYRLKLVNGEAPLVVPRTTSKSVDQFRLCFTCHDSAPFMTVDNLDTNFRSDVSDTCVPLNNPASDNVNKHYFHLFTQQVWDSDWDGVPSDSAPSCTACHNVHGPQLRDATVTNAPGMIRTGELIGRVSEGALNLDYFIDPCRDQTLSTTNELYTSTGGVFMDDPQQLQNPQLRGGVCGMCHSTNEPYWRDANISIFSCDKCHTNVTHFVELDPLTDLSYDAPGQPCSNCHVVADWSEIEGTEHNVSTNGAGSCLTCHQSPRPEVIATIASGSNSGLNPIHCLDCHSDKNLTPHMYDHTTNDPAGTLTYAPITPDAECTTCHSGDVVTAVHSTGGCDTCHTTAPALKSSAPKLDFNAGSASSTCTTCHFDGNNGPGFSADFHGISYTHIETQTRHNNLQGSDLQGGPGYDCLYCHNDMTDAEAKLTKHMATDTAADCLRCHYPNTWGGLSDTPAQSVITNGKSGGLNLPQNCEDCHTAKGVYLLHGLNDNGLADPDDVSDVHDNFMADGLSATSTCSSCHNPQVTEQDRLNLHTTTGTGSGDCLTCHQNTTDMGSGTTPQLIIEAGEGPGGGSQFCDSCHVSIGTSWVNHTPVDHTDTGFSYVLANTDTSTTTVNCVGCHTGDVITAVHDRASAGGTAPCQKCHASDGSLQGSAVANGGECTTCHTTYFDGHDHAVDNAQDAGTAEHDVAMGSDVSGTQSCNECHVLGGTLFGDNWDGSDDIASLHSGGCGMCHNETRTSDVDAAYPGGVPDVIANGSTVTCLDCHVSKSSVHMDHLTYDGGAGPGVVTDTAKCTTCHNQGQAATDANLVVGIHGSCGTCHANGIGGGALVDRSGGGGILDDLVNYETINGGHGGECITCHVSYDADFAAGHEVADHQNTSAADVIASDTNCATTCHTATTAADITTLTQTLTHNSCTTCHTATNDGTLQSATNGDASGATINTGTAATCADCHGAPFNYDTDFSSHDYLTPHDGVATTPSCITVGCHDTASDGPTVISATHTDTCDTCHTNQLGDGSLKAGTRGDASNHVEGNTSACADCHTDHNSDWYFHQLDHTDTGFSYVLANTDTSTTTVNCVGCHTGDVITAVHDRASAGGSAPCQKCHVAACSQVQ